MLTATLIISSSLLIVIGIAHSILGEKYILKRLLRRNDLPQVLGSDLFTKRVLRFAWHITTIAWWGFAGIIISFLFPDTVPVKTIVLLITSLTFLLSGAISGISSRGKHLSWIVFLVIAICTFYAAIAI